MLAELGEAYPQQIRACFDEASQVLGYDLWKLSQQGPEDQLNQTQRTQPALLCTGVAIWRLWQAQGGPVPKVMAGHSLGEYTALVCAEAIDFAAAVALVAKRGALMQEAVPTGAGAMAAILGLDDAAIIDVCAQAAQGEVVSAANFNAPGQVVIAGQRSAVDRAIALASERGARRAVMLAVSAPSHCALMMGAAQKLSEALRAIEVRTPTIPVIHNVDGQARTQPEAIREALVQQLYQPVRWVDTVQGMLAAQPACLIEAGPGKVLAGLGKRIAKEVSVWPVVDNASLEQALQAAKEAENA
jgi:[acyl-carrier-protein] S-malonyltransferase